MPSSDDSFHDLDGNPDKARMVAEKALQRLRLLNEKYPSPDLAEAIRKLEEWRAKQPPD
jgi:hypothetical protein